MWVLKYEGIQTHNERIIKAKNLSEPVSMPLISYVKVPDDVWDLQAEMHLNFKKKGLTTKSPIVVETSEKLMLGTLREEKRAEQRERCMNELERLVMQYNGGAWKRLRSVTSPMRKIIRKYDQIFGDD